MMDFLKTAFVKSHGTDFTLSNGEKSSYYFDFRRLLGYPELMRKACADLGNTLSASGVSRGDYDVVCGVPDGATPLASIFSLKNNVPLIMLRKSAKEYGLQNMIEGDPSTFAGKRVLLLEDVVTSGASIANARKVLENEGFTVTKSACFLVRGDAQKYMHDIVSLIPRAVYDLFLASRKSNIILSPDVDNVDDLIALIETVAPFICAVKIHFDLYNEWTPRVCSKFSDLINKHNLIVINDRKYDDIAHIVLYQIAVLESQFGFKMIHTVLPFSGPDLVRTMNKAGNDMILIRDMSTTQAWQTSEYIRFVERFTHLPHVIGFVSQRTCESKPTFQPGISIVPFVTDHVHPSKAVGDFLIVGRDIHNHSNPVARIKEYL